MTWTILILVIAAALYLLGGKLLHKDGKKEITPAAIYAKKALNALAVVLAIVGVNRLGFGTSYYLTESNPSILQTMAQNMQQQRSGSSNKEIKGHIKKNSAEMIKYAPVLGNENADAKKTIFVFTDATCPYCVRLHGELKRVLADRSDVRIVVKNFSIHGVLSDGAAKASIAAKLQGNDKAAALYQLLMDKPYWPEDMSKVKQEDLPKIINKNIMEIAKKVGLDTAKLEQDMNGEAVQREMAQVRDLAQKFQINGTPYVIVGDQAFPGAIPYDQIISALK